MYYMYLRIFQIVLCLFKFIFIFVMLFIGFKYYDWETIADFLVYSNSTASSNSHTKDDLLHSMERRLCTKQSK